MVQNSNSPGKEFKKSQIYYKGMVCEHQTGSYHKGTGQGERREANPFENGKRNSNRILCSTIYRQTNANHLLKQRNYCKEIYLAMSAGKHFIIAYIFTVQ